MASSLSQSHLVKMEKNYGIVKPNGYWEIAVADKMKKSFILDATTRANNGRDNASMV